MRNEIKYWLKSLYTTEYLTENEFNSITTDIKEIIALLMSITKNIKMNNDK